MQWCPAQRPAHRRCSTRLEHDLCDLLSHHRRSVRRDLRCCAHLAGQSVVFSKMMSCQVAQEKLTALPGRVLLLGLGAALCAGLRLRPGLLPFPEADLFAQITHHPLN